MCHWVIIYLKYVFMFVSLADFHISAKHPGRGLFFCHAHLYFSSSVSELVIGLVDLVTGLEQQSFVLFLEENYLYGLMNHVFLDYIYFLKSGVAMLIPSR